MTSQLLAIRMDFKYAVISNKQRPTTCMGWRYLTFKHGEKSPKY